MAGHPILTVQANWRIDPELKRRIDMEAAKRGLRPARVVEGALRAMLELVKEEEQGAGMHPSSGGRDGS